MKDCQGDEPAVHKSSVKICQDLSIIKNRWQIVVNPLLERWHVAENNLDKYYHMLDGVMVYSAVIGFQ